MTTERNRSGVIGYYRARAKRDYWCDDCGQVIRKGEPYRRITFKAADRVFRCDHVHLVCPTGYRREK